MADDDGIGLAERADQPGRVGGGGDQVIAPRRLVAAAIAAQIDRYRPVAGLGQRDELVPPGPPELREAVQEQHERPLAHARHVEARTVRGHRPVRPWAGDLYDRLSRHALPSGGLLSRWRNLGLGASP